MVIRRKAGLLEEIEFKKPPIIYLQVWDKDVLTKDEYLAALELNLSNMYAPYPAAQLCKPYPKKRKRINLFKRKVINGWFPLQSNAHPSQRSQAAVQNVSVGGNILGLLSVTSWVIPGQNAAEHRSLHGCGGRQPAGWSWTGSTNGLGAALVSFHLFLALANLTMFSLN